MISRPLFETLATVAVTVAALIGLAAPGLVRPQGVISWSFVTPAEAQNADMAELMQPGPLPDIVQGSKDAKVTIVEYASLTCSHCQTFHATTYPQLKAKYIDTGKVRFILREFPLDPLSTAAFMLARCGGGDQRRIALVDLLFDQQKNWAFVQKPVDALLATVKQAGFTQENFDSCLKNQTVYDGVQGVMKRGQDKFGVNSTPTFFINGKTERGALSFDELDKILAPLVAS